MMKANTVKMLALMLIIAACSMSTVSGGRFKVFKQPAVAKFHETVIAKREAPRDPFKADAIGSAYGHFKRPVA